MLLNKLQGEPGDTDPIIIFMPRAVLYLLDMKQVTERAGTVLPASQRGSYCTAAVGLKAWQALTTTAPHSNICAIPVRPCPSSCGKLVAVSLNQITSALIRELQPGQKTLLLGTSCINVLTYENSPLSLTYKMMGVK